MRRLALFCGGFAAGIFLAQYLLPGGWLLSGGLVCLALGFGALLLPECWRKRAILCLVGAALALGISLEESAVVLAKVPHVKGRVEIVPTPGKEYTILIDYAHTPDSMVNVLQTVKEIAKGRTVAVFGCGGDRD